MRFAVAALVLALAVIAPTVAAKGGGHSHSATASTHSATASHGSGSHSASGSHSGGSSDAATSSHSNSSRSGPGSHSTTPPWVHRDSHGKIARDPRQLNDFKKQHACPSTGKTYGSCPGYTVDHVVPLKRGGADSPSNMQWQSNAAAKEKDKWE